MSGLLPGLRALREALDPQPEPDPVGELLDVAKTFTAFPREKVEKRHTRDGLEELPLDELQVEPENQRPPDREKIKSMVASLRAGGQLDPIKVNRRHDGTLWITDGQHRAAAAAICGHKTIDGTVTEKPSWDEFAETNIVAKVNADANLDAVGLLLSAGAERDGKQLVLTLGKTRRVTYMSHEEGYVADAERGRLQVDAPDARLVLDQLGLSEISSPESASVE